MKFCRTLSVSLLAAAAVLALAQTPNQPKQTPAKSSPTVREWFRTNFVNRITVTGFRRLGYHSHAVSGDQEAFNLTQTASLDRRRTTDFGSIFVSGRQVLGLFNFDFNIQDDRFNDPQSQKFTLDFQKYGASIQVGDIQGRLLNTNRFARFEKTLRGAAVGYKSGGFEMRAITSEVRGEPRTISLNGANSAGPYFLQSNQIVRGSERVTVDGEDQAFGTDYSIDYDLGAITFLNRSTGEARLISPTSVIVVTYEVFGFSGQKGTLLGAGAAYDFGRIGKLGLTAMTQTTGGENRLSTRLERFQGFGSPSTPYFLQFKPLAGTPISVRVNGILQAAGIDYQFDTVNTSLFFFTRFMPASDTIDVLYTPTPTSTVNGDRETIGIDYTIPLGSKVKDRFVRQGQISLYQAVGRLKNTPTSQSGAAKGMDIRWSQGKWDAFGGLRDIPDGYTTIESIGFNRNEKANDLRLNYRVSPNLTYGFNQSNSAISQRTVDNNGNTKVNGSRFTRIGLTADYLSQGKGAPWSASHTRTASRALVGETVVDSTRLSTSRTFRAWSTSLGFNNQLGSRPVNGAKKRFGTQGFESRTTFSPSPMWGLGLNASLNRIQADGQTGLGRDLQLTANYRANEKLNSILSITDSDAGKVSTINGFNSGYGFGFDGNGFSGGATGNAILGTASFRRATIQTNYQPSDRLSLGLGLNYFKTQGSVSSNSETRNLLFGADWDLGRSQRVNAVLAWDSSQFVDSDQQTNTSTISVNWTGAPPGRFSYSLGLNLLLSSGGEFGQDSYTADATFGWRLAKRQSLSFNVYGGRTSGYLPQENMDAVFSYRYQIWRALAVNVNYAWRKVEALDPLQTSGAFRSRGLTLELAFNFGQ